MFSYTNKLYEQACLDHDLYNVFSLFRQNMRCFRLGGFGLWVFSSLAVLEWFLGWQTKHVRITICTYFNRIIHAFKYFQGCIIVFFTLVLIMCIICTTHPLSGWVNFMEYYIYGFYELFPPLMAQQQQLRKFGIIMFAT